MLLSTFKKYDFSCSTSTGDGPKAFGSYMAGLIEGDGAIIVPDPVRGKHKYQNARIKIAFNSKDEPLAKKLHALLGFGRFEYPKAGNSLVFYVGDYDGLYKMVTLINGKFRTPKLEALHKLIDWLNSKRISSPLRMEKYSELVKEGLDLSPILENAWLA